MVSYHEYAYNIITSTMNTNFTMEAHQFVSAALCAYKQTSGLRLSLFFSNPVSIYALDDSTRQLLQEENFLGRFSPKDLVEQLSHNGDAPPANESTLESLDPKPYIRTFEAALNELKRLREQVSSRENDVSGDVDQAELAHSRIVLNLQKSVQSTVSEYTDMEQLMAEVSKQTSSLGDKMDRISGQHQKAIASHFLINCYLSFVKKSSCLELERMWKDGPSGQRKCATYVRQLLILSSKIDTVEACRRAQSDIEKFAEKIEKDLLDVFDQAYRNADMLVMKDSADVLTDFNGGTNVIMAFVNQHDFFIAQDKVVAANSEPDEAVLKELADPNNSEPQFDHVTEELCSEVVSVVNTETEIIKRVFKEPVVVLQVFLQRVFAQRIQQRIELFLSSAEAMSTLAYVRSLHLAYNVVSSLVKKLKDFFSSENLDTHDSLAALLDQNFADIFIPHIDKNRYFESEKKSLGELISSSLWKFAEFHEKKSSHKEGGLLGRITHSLDNEDNKGIGNFMRNFRDRTERHSTPDSPVPLEPEDGEIKIDVVQMCLKCLAESIQRVLELAHQNEINDCVVSLHDLLIESVGKSYIETGLDDAIVSRDVKTISFVHLKTIRRVLTAIRLMSVVINSVIVPLTDSHGQGRRYIVMQTNNFFTKCEEKINSILQITLDIVSARVTVLLSKQKKRDFLPKEDTLSHQPTSTCLEIISFLTEVHDAGAIFLIEQTLKQFLFHVGIDFRDALLEHLKKFTVSVAGGSVLSMDMANYTKMVNSWGISELSEAFVIVNDLAGIFAAELPMVNSLVKEGPLSKTKPFILKEYLSKRSDYQGGTVNKMFAATNKIQALGMM